MINVFPFQTCKLVSIEFTIMKLQFGMKYFTNIKSYNALEYSNIEKLYLQTQNMF